LFGEGGRLAFGEAGGSFGENAVAEAGFADAVEIERGAFDDDAFGGGVNFGAEAAHDASEGNRYAARSDDGVARVEINSFVVEEGELLAFFGGADGDFGHFAAAEGKEFVVVEKVEWLAGEEHEIVGPVDEWVDSADVRKHERNADLAKVAEFGEGRVGCVGFVSEAGFEDDGGVAGAEFGVFNLDVERDGAVGAGDGFFADFGPFASVDAAEALDFVGDFVFFKVGWGGELFAKNAGDFTGEADDTEAVGAVGEGFIFDVKEGAVEPEDAGEWGAD